MNEQGEPLAYIALVLDEHDAQAPRCGSPRMLTAALSCLLEGYRRSGLESPCPCERGARFVSGTSTSIVVPTPGARRELEPSSKSLHPAPHVGEPVAVSWPLLENPLPLSPSVIRSRSPLRRTSTRKREQPE